VYSRILVYVIDEQLSSVFPDTRVSSVFPDTTFVHLPPPRGTRPCIRFYSAYSLGGSIRSKSAFSNDTYYIHIQLHDKWATITYIYHYVVDENERDCGYVQ